MSPKKAMIQPAEDTFANDGAQEGGGFRAGNLQVFRSGSLKFAVFENDIATVAEWRSPTPLPKAPAGVLGVVSIQGRMLTVLDPAILLGQSPNGNSSGGFIVALRGDEQLALRVDDKADAQVVAAKINRQQPASNPWLLGVINSDEGEISVLNVKQLFGLAIRGRERRRRSF